MPSVRVDIGGRSLRLAMPLGALAEVAEVNPKLAVVAVGLQTGAWELAELRAVLNAGCAYGCRSMTGDEIIETVKLRRASEIATELMLAAFTDAEKSQADAAVESSQ